MKILQKIKFWLHTTLAAAAKPTRDGKPQDTAEEQQINKITLQSAWEVEKRAILHEWVKPEAVAKRLADNEEWVKKSLAEIREMRVAAGLPAEEPPLPPMENLPKEMRNQQPSTIRRMLDHAGWEYIDGKWVLSGR